MARVVGSLEKYPARLSFAWYLATIIVGSLALMQSACRDADVQPVSWVDALFTATSATCVTGLTVRSTALDFNFWGQLVILVLVQVGGIGIMTVTSYVMLHLGRREGLQHRLVFTETLGADANADLKGVLRNVLAFTLLIEGMGFALLAIRNLLDYPISTALWNALFHTVSAFCNAGFALHDDSLTRYQGDPLVNVVICALVVLGGIGFPVILDLRRYAGSDKPWRERWERLHLHSKLTLIGTAALLVGSSLTFMVLEWDGALRETVIWKRPMIATFHAVSCRTAGFNTLDLRQLTNASLFISVLLMGIGAGACSTAGGFKISTISVLILHAWSTFRGRGRLALFRREISRESIAKAEAMMVLFIVVVIVGLTLLLVVEHSQTPFALSESDFMMTTFEVVSALGTVGLSLGLTAQLTAFGKFVVILLMFIGRLGPITIVVALSGTVRKKSLVYPDEEPMYG